MPQKNSVFMKIENWKCEWTLIEILVFLICLELKSSLLCVCFYWVKTSYRVHEIFHVFVDNFIQQVRGRIPKIDSDFQKFSKKIFSKKTHTAFDQNWPVWSSININGHWYVAMSESGKSLGIDCWNINLIF
jgi:hypothetical protein